MKKVVSMFMVVIMVFSLVTLPVFAEEIPTAKIVATLDGDAIPQAGEKFTVTISAAEITTGCFVSGQVGIKYPVDVVTPVRYTKDAPTTVTNARQMIGNITNKFTYDEEECEYTGKFSVISSIDLTTGEGVIAVYIDINAESQTTETVTNGTYGMFSLAFMLNEGYTYDDFYLTLIRENAVLFLDEDHSIVSEGTKGNVTVQGIGNAVEPTSNVNNTNLLLYDYVVGTYVNEAAAITESGDVESDINADIGIVYNDEYYEAVLKSGETLNASVTAANSGTTAQDLVCYIAEYNSEGALISLTSDNTITVPAGETVTSNVTKTFSNANTVSAKIFLWGKDSFIPVGNDITLNAEVSDYYGDTFADANLVETNKRICGTINLNADVDIVRIQPEVTGIYMLKIVSDSAVYNLYDSEQTLLSATAIDGNYKIYNLSKDETYYIKMTGSANSSYHIKPASPETVTKAMGIGATLSDNSDYDLYEFTAGKTGEYIVTAVGTDGVKATLYNSDFEKMVASDTGDEDVSFRITANMEGSATYYILVEQKSGQTEESSYSLYVEEPFAIVDIY